ncbi:copper-resistance protein, CopA family [Beggiatoa alba B18LD]|uniref:Copper-resistance protein, CopA family n=1 Tax=Beggiatoa alba B18LD TaxID=395493 RepID=I3CDZ0_9GAMM|nr:copper resistance system multicopper oxidase [Beggiatoa alba]EIJ41833.1 copper-resistance protein, CopA family [Beggiatoa alba B18LD]
MKRLFFMALSLLGFLCLSVTSFANTTEYTLTIARNPVNLTGNTVSKITINGTIPGPTLYFTEGDEAVIHVINQLAEDTSVHWHGILLPPLMDGVPHLNGFTGIKPNATFTYRFKIRQTGTYWYHAHSMGQEQDGHYGAIVIRPQQPDNVKVDRDYVVMLSDFSEEESSTILANLKMSSDYYQNARRTVGDFWSSARQQGVSKAWEEAKMWAEMRMLPTDLSDVSGYTFLVNGKNNAQNWTGLFKAGEKVRLRFINGSAMSFYDVRIPKLAMTVIEADGQAVEPVTVNEFRFGVAETYDVIVTPTEDIAYTIVAEALDRTGFALGTLAPQAGMRGEMPSHRPRTLLTMADMGMSHGEHANHQSTSSTDSSQNNKMSGQNEHTSHAGHQMAGMSTDSNQDYETGVKGSGWADAGTPQGDKALSYKDLRYRGTQADTRQPVRDIEIRLGGNMERYIWTMNGKKFANAEPIHFEYGERIRFKFINETMMAHPMHLHGMFMQLENGQPMDKLPNKHTIIIAPGDTYSALLTANESGDWVFHCHLLYHMATGMMTKIVVSKQDPNKDYSLPPPSSHDMSSHDMSQMEHSEHNAHQSHEMQTQPVTSTKSADMPATHDMSQMEHSQHQQTQAVDKKAGEHHAH